MEWIQLQTNEREIGKGSKHAKRTIGTIRAEDGERAKINRTENHEYQIIPMGK